MDDLRAQFPVFETIAYLNAGTNGPVPGRGVEAAAQVLREGAERGRGGEAFFEALIGRLGELRSRVAALMGAQAEGVAITTSTTAGVNAVLGALDLGQGDEVLTSDEEHPGLLAPLAAARERRGLEIRTAPFGDLAGAVGERTRLIACSHVSWVTGQVVDAPALADTGVSVLLDGAQGLGAVPVDVAALGCDFYAASGQKWLCGPNGLGYLYVRPELARELVPAHAGYGSLADPERALELDLHPDARRFNSDLLAPHDAAWALAALDVLEEAGWGAVHRRARELAAELADKLGDRVVPRGESTLVTWHVDDCKAAATALAADGIVVRTIPGREQLRASVGAWTSEEDLERLVAATSRS